MYNRIALYGETRDTVKKILQLKYRDGNREVVDVYDNDRHVAVCLYEAAEHDCYPEDDDWSEWTVLSKTNIRQEKNKSRQVALQQMFPDALFTLKR